MSLKKLIPNKKFLFTVLSVLTIIGYGFVVFAAAPTGGYTPGSTLDPNCAPGDTDCTVTILNGGGSNNNPNSILYTDPNGLTTTDNLFTRNSANNLTYIGRTYSGTRAGELTITLSPLFLEFSTNPNPAVFQPGETINFDNQDTHEISTGVYSGFAGSIIEHDIDKNTSFQGNGPNDLNINIYSHYADYAQVPGTITVTITEKDVPFFAYEDNYNGMFTVGETVTGQNSGATGTVITAQGGLTLGNILGTFESSETLSGNSSGATAPNDYNGSIVTDVYSYDNGDISGFGLTNISSSYYNGNVYINFGMQAGHQIGDTWTTSVTDNPIYIHIHTLSSSSINVNDDDIQYIATGQTSNASSTGGLYSENPLASIGSEIGFSNFSQGNINEEGAGIVTAINGNNYTVQIIDGIYTIGDVVFSEVNGDEQLSILTAASTDPISYIINSGISITDNAAGYGLHGTVFEQSDGTITGTMGALDGSSINGNTVMFGTVINTSGSDANSFNTQVLSKIEQGVIDANDRLTILSITADKFSLTTSTNQGDVGFTVSQNNNNELLPAWSASGNTQILPSSMGSSGQVLTTDGSGNLSWADGSGGNNGGSSAISVGSSGNTLYSSGLSGTGQDGSNNIFFGNYAGQDAAYASNSNFFGTSAGYGASSASYSNFFGQSAGQDAAYASNSNFFGTSAGNGATSASNSNFLGSNAGQGATDAIYSNFLGSNAGQGATDAIYSNFIGFNAGSGATNVQYSNFIGYQSGFNATDARDSNFFGVYSGQGATYAEYSNFMGRGSGTNSTNANNSNFFGYTAGAEAINANNSNFLGQGAGYGATNAASSNFFGTNAGYGATDAFLSNFMGQYAGYQATNATNSNFFGSGAGSGATDATNSNFFGSQAGSGATTAYYSNFLGYQAGYNATNASNSIFIGKNTGFNDAVDNTMSGSSIAIGDSAGTGGFSNSIALGASAVNTKTNQFLVGSSYVNWQIAGVDYVMPSADGTTGQVLSTDGSGTLSWATGSSAISVGTSGSTLYSSGLTGTGQGDTITGGNIFFGENAGSGATSASNSNFFGQSAGLNATAANNSNFFGSQAGSGATTAYYSNFLGSQTGQNATNASYSNFFGATAGNGATNASNSNFIGQSAGANAISANNSNFFGLYTGSGATGANNSNFMGNGAGNNATNAANSNFLGYDAGLEATNADGSNFFGAYAGYTATNAYRSNFLGRQAGQNATNASNSNFFGELAGYSATNASYANFFGFQAGLNAYNATNSIFIGRNAGYYDTVDNTADANDFSILIGKSTSTGGFENSIAIGGSATNTASNQFMIGSAIRPIDTTRINGSASTQCTITTGTGIACTSDERVKTNITDLTTDTLDKLLNVKTVSYNWLQNPTSKTQIGFLAQDLEQYFPELVETDSVGMKSVYYAQMTPILVEAIREMNLKIVSINDMDTPNTWRDAIIAWFGNVENGITKLFVKEIETKTLCVADDTGDKTCITKSQLDQLLNGSVNGSIAPAPSPSPDPSPTPDPDQNPTPDTNPGTDNTDPGTSDVPSDTPTDSGTPPADSPAPASEPAPATPTE